MIINLIQFLLSFCICTAIHPMDHKKNTNNPRDKVTALLNKNNDKLTQWNCSTISNPTKLTIQPLSNAALNRSNLLANHISYLLKNNNHDKALARFQIIEPIMPYDLSILKPTTQKAYRHIEESIKKIALQGNNEAQELFTTRLIDGCQPLFDNPKLSVKSKPENITYALNLLKFPIMLSENNTKTLIKLRDQTPSSTLSYIIQTALYIHAKTNEKKSARLHILQDKHCPENPEIETLCQFFINYGDVTLSGHDAAKKFMQTINIQKNVPFILSTIVKTPLCAPIINKLSNARLHEEDSLFPNLNYFLAELYYKCNNMKQAHIFYVKNIPSYLRTKNVLPNALMAYIASAEQFCTQDIEHLSSLSDELSTQLQKITTRKPQLSYGIGLLTHALINNNLTMSITKKISLIINGLQHLEYAQAHKQWDNQALKKIATISTDLHLSLSMMYYEIHNKVGLSLEHIIKALGLLSQQSNNPTLAKLLAILTDTKKQNLDFYTHHALWITTILNLICNNHEQKYSAQKHNYSTLQQFASSDLCSRLLPYLEKSYQTNTINKDEIAYLLALIHENSNNYHLAYHYIHLLPPSIPYPSLNKALIYVAVKKPVPLSEIEAITTSFLNKKNPSPHDHTILSLLIPSITNFLISTNNYPHAIALINKLVITQSMLTTAIDLTFEITKNLEAIKDPSPLKKWILALCACQLYHAIESNTPDSYDADTNIKIGSLLIKKSPQHAYEKIIAHFSAAKSSANVSPEMTHIIHNTCDTMYCAWAESMRHEEKTFLRLLDTAIHEYESSNARYKKALFLLHNKKDQHLINHALELLQDNIINNSTNKASSQLLLAQAYLNFCFSDTLFPIMHTLIPLNIEQAIIYLESCANPDALEYLANIYGGTYTRLDVNVREKYKNIERAIACTTRLIDSNENIFKALALRSCLYSQYGDDQQALSDINLLLDTKNFPKKSSITKNDLLQKKIHLLLENNPDNHAYTQALECLKKLKLSHKKNSFIFFKQLPAIKDYISKIIINTDVSDSALEWCCFAAELECSELPITEITDLQKCIAAHLLKGAHNGNINAQLVAACYLDALNMRNTNLFYIGLDYAYKALCNPKITEKNAETAALVQLLQQLTEKGELLAYFILCNYYKQDTKQLEKTMLLFSKSKTQNHSVNETAIIEDICASCREKLLTYISPYIKNPKKGSLIGAIATFTLGSLYRYSNRADLLASASSYLQLVLEPLCNTFNLLHFQAHIHSLLGIIYYQIALAEKQKCKNFNLDFLRKSAQLRYLPAIHTLANLYIEQRKNIPLTILEKDLIYANDALPLLTEDIKKKNPHPDSLLLAKECITAQEELEQLHIITEKRVARIAKLALEKNLVRHKTVAPIFGKVVRAYQGENPQSVMPLLGTAALQQDPNAYILLAFICLQEETINHNYDSSESSLRSALSHGLIPSTQQFCNPSFIHTLIAYIETLLNKKDQPLIKKELFLIIKESLEASGINMSDFYLIFHKITTIDLSVIPEWNNPLADSMQLTETCLTMIKKAKEGLTKTEQTSQEKLNVYNVIKVNCEHIIKDISKEITNQNAVENRVGCVARLAREKNMTKNDKIYSIHYTNAMIAYKNEGSTACLLLMEKAALLKDPNASIYLALNYLTEDMAEKDYTTAEYTLTSALSYGLVPATKQFFNLSFFNTLILYIESLLKYTHLPLIQNWDVLMLLHIIKDSLETSGINMTDFYDIVFQSTDIYLPCTPEWNS